jgi:hypothetical protein
MRDVVLDVPDQGLDGVDVGHGFGLVTGTSAEGWVPAAIRFWQRAMPKRRHHKRFVLASNAARPYEVEFLEGAVFVRTLEPCRERLCAA